MKQHIEKSDWEAVSSNTKLHWEAWYDSRDYESPSSDSPISRPLPSVQHLIDYLDCHYSEIKIKRTPEGWKVEVGTPWTERTRPELVDALWEICKEEALV